MIIFPPYQRRFLSRSFPKRYELLNFRSPLKTKPDGVGYIVERGSYITLSFLFFSVNIKASIKVCWCRCSPCEVIISGCQKEATKDRVFILAFHHGGNLQSETNNYVNGKLKKLNCEEDKLSYFELTGIVEEELGYKTGYVIMWKDPSQKMNLLKDDIGVLSVIDGLKDGDEVNFYLDHFDLREEDEVFATQGKGKSQPSNDKSSQVHVPCRSKRNFRASRVVRGELARVATVEGEMQTQPQHQEPKRTRGPNQAHRLRPDKSKGETTFPLYWTSLYRPTGDYAELFAQYMGDESRHPKRYPLNCKWGETHTKSFDKFFLQAQEDYEWLPEPDSESEHPGHDVSLNLQAVYDTLKVKMQNMVRGNRYTLKTDRYDVWVDTPIEERAALLQSKAFSDVDKETWSSQCAYFESKEVKEQSKRNKENRNSSLHGRATYTGGSRNMTRAIEKSRKKIKSSGGTPSLATDYLSTHTTNYNPDSGTYTYPDQATEKYCKLVQDELQASGVGSSGETNPMVMTAILDKVHGGHRGGYERGLGVGVSRSILKRTSTPAATLPTPRERRLETELKSHKDMLEKYKSETALQMAEHQSQMAILKANYDELKKMVSTTASVASNSRETSPSSIDPSGTSRQVEIQLMERCIKAGLSSAQIMDILKEK